MEQSVQSQTLRELPLHVITQLYGQQGLERRFDIETTRFEPTEQDRLVEAKQWFLELHRDHRRSNEPYANHLLRAAIRVMAPSHYGVDDVNIIISTLGHDSVEDQSKKITASERTVSIGLDEQTMAINALKRKYGFEVAETIEAVTNPEFDKTGDWLTEYRDHVHESMLRVPSARVVKVSDFTENGVGVMYSPASRLAHFASKYAPMVPIFKDVIPQSDTPLSDRAKRLIMHQLTLAEGRFANILETRL